MYVQKNGGWRQQIGESTPALKAEVDALLLFRCWPVRPDVKTWYRGSMIFCILSWVILFLIQAPITMIKNQPPPTGFVPLFYLLSFFFRLLLLLFRLLSQQADRYVPLTGFHVKCYTKHPAHVYAVCARVAHTRPRTYAKLWGCVSCRGSAVRVAHQPSCLYVRGWFTTRVERKHKKSLRQQVGTDYTG